MTNKILWKTLHSPSLVGAALLLSAGSALATEKIATKFDMTSQVDPVTTEEIEESISPESNVAIALMSEPPSPPLYEQHWSMKTLSQESKDERRHGYFSARQPKT